MEMAPKIKKKKEMEGQRPWDQRSARVWNFFNNVSDWWKISTWPGYLQTMALKEHKSYRDRYRLFLFFVGNGLDPMTAYHWVVMRDYVDGDLKWEAYDASAHAQLTTQIKETESGKIFVGREWFDMILGRVNKG